MKQVFEGNAQAIEQEGGYCSPAVEIMMGMDAVDLTDWINREVFAGQSVVPLRITIEWEKP